MRKIVKTHPQGTLVSQTVAMPADTNPSGPTFGDWIMAQMDVGGDIFAKEMAKIEVAVFKYVAVNKSFLHTPLPKGFQHLTQNQLGQLNHL